MVNRTVVRAATEPLVAVLFFVAWISYSMSASGSVVGTYVDQRSDTFFTNPYGTAMVVALAIAIALVRYSPVASVSIVGGMLVCQLMFWPPRFSQISWIAYVGILLVTIGVGTYGGRLFRWIGFGLMAIFGVAVSALLTLPIFSLSGKWGTINGAPWSSPEVWSGFWIYSGVWVGLVVGAWFIGRRIRRSLAARRPVTTSDVAAPSIETLSPREHEIFLLAARGLSNRDIAATAHIGESTVKTHLTSISAKLGFASRAELVVYAYNSGAVTPTMASR